MKTKIIKFDYKIFLIISLVLFVALTTISTSNAASTIYVNGSSGNDSWDGTSATPMGGTIGPKATIQNGTNTVDDSGTVNVADGTYNENVAISKNVNLRGQSQDKTIIDGSASGSTVTINSGIVSINHFTIQNGQNTLGGGILNYGNLTLNNTNIQLNNASMGGAIYNYGNLTLNNSNIQLNNATFGGGISNNLFAKSTLINSNIQQNRALSYGGGIHNVLGLVTITDCNIQQNTATTYGGGIYNNGGTVIISDSDIQQNTASSGNGGGIFSTGTLTITDCNILQNTATYGGGIRNLGTLTITGSNIRQNTATSGGAIHNAQGGLVTANFNCIVANSPNAINSTVNTFDAQYNWWGSNNPDFATLIIGTVDFTPWLYLTIIADPTTINNGKTSLITASFNNLFNGTTVTLLDPLTGHIPDGTPVTFKTDKGSIGSKIIDKETTAGITTATLTADETAGIAHITATTDAQAVNTEVTINPKSSMYLTITPNKTNPVVGDTVIYSLKVGNHGPDTATNVFMAYVVPEGLEFAGAKVDVGTYNYGPATRTITWNIGDVPVGDPYMWLSLKILRSGSFLINPQLSTTTYDPTLNTDTQSLTIHASAATNTVNAATNTVTMQHTGMPLMALIMALFMVIGGMISSKK